MASVSSIIDDMISFCVKMASDNTHGYSQSVRSLCNITNPTSFDCSSLVITAVYYAFNQAGLTTQRDYVQANCHTTADMLNLTNVGFEIITRNQTAHAEMKKGDIELNVSDHTCMAVDSNTIVHARSSEGTTNTIDDSGNEIRTQAWYLYSNGWNYRLRFTGKGISGLSTSSSSKKSAATQTATTVPIATSLALFKGETGSDGKNTTLLATWQWDGTQSHLDSFEWKAVWYATKPFNETNRRDLTSGTATSESRNVSFSLPTNTTAKYVRFVVKAKAKQYSDTKTSYTTSGKATTKTTKTYYFGDTDGLTSWSNALTYTIDTTTPDKPSAPTVEIINKYNLLASLDNIYSSTTAIKPTYVQFAMFKDDLYASVQKSDKVNISTYHAEHKFKGLEAGHSYKVRARTGKQLGDNVDLSETNGVWDVSVDWSDWSDYSESVSIGPAEVSSITSIKAMSKTSVKLTWGWSDGATSYDIGYITKDDTTTIDKDYFNHSDAAQVTSGVTIRTYTLTGLEMGHEYFFSVRAVNDSGTSDWCEPVSVVLGKKPAAPTTWSSTTTAINGETVIFYWVHNAQDGSSQTTAEIEVTVNGTTSTITKENTTDEDHKDDTSYYEYDTSGVGDAVTILWRVRTKGVTDDYSDWSVQREINVYNQPSIVLSLTQNDAETETITSFPFIVSLSSGPTGQVPTGYSIEIISNEEYESIDSTGETKIVSAGATVYSQFYDTSEYVLFQKFSAGDVNLVNGVSYVIKVAVAMNSGLTAENERYFTVEWGDTEGIIPSARFNIDTDNLVCYIHPYCTRLTVNVMRIEKTQLGVNPNLFRLSSMTDHSNFVLSDNATDWTAYFRYANGSADWHTFTAYGDGTYVDAIEMDEQEINYGVSFVRKAEDISLTVGQTYTISVYAKCSVAGKRKLSIGLSYMSTSGTWVWRGGTNAQDIETADEWKQYTLTFTLEDTDVAYINYAITFTKDDAVACTGYLRAPKMEIGDTATKWVPAASADSIDSDYYLTEDEFDGEVGDMVVGELTSDGRQIFNATTEDGTETYCAGIITGSEIASDVTLSVYRWGFDGSLTEIATDIENSDVDSAVWVCDPHPPLDYARYRVVATTESNGAVTYADIPSVEVGVWAVVLQWNESYHSYNTVTDVDGTVTENQTYKGSMLKLPYNIDTADNSTPDTSAVEYIGRAHPVSYYGTQLGVKATWNVDIDKEDKETIYQLRRLSKYMGDVYVREPGGVGYWAQITVSFTKKHDDLVIPVTLNITQVEGGI